MRRSIEPLAVEYRQSKYHGGRATTISAVITDPVFGPPQRIQLRSTPDAAQTALRDLESRSSRATVSGSQAFRMLADIVGRKRRTVPHVVTGIAPSPALKLSATPAGAQALLTDLMFFCMSYRNAANMHESVIGKMLDFAIRAPVTRRQYVRTSIDAGVRRYGPWIYAFANRISRGNATAADLALLPRLLEHAEHAGYSRAAFYSKHKSPRVLLWPLQSFLLEFALGGAHWWQLVEFTPPVELMKRESERTRTRRLDGMDTGVTSLYRKYLGTSWRQVITRGALVVPPRLRRL